MSAATRIAVAGSIAASAGCFYIEPINQRPALDIRPVSSEAVFRNQTITLEAIANDPEDQVVAFQWRVYACTDAVSIPSCDPEPFFTGILPDATFRVPPFRVDPDAGGPDPAPPVESLRVILEGRDELGAEARPEQLLVVMVQNVLPKVMLRMSSTHGAVVGTPIDVYARYADSDDTPQNVILDWTVYSPSQVPGTLAEIAVPSDGDPDHLQAGKRFTPQVTGPWDLRVMARDPFGGMADEHLDINVAQDAPPCLDVWEPIASAVPAPVTEPALLRVVQVRDDLDAFPRASSESFIGETGFAWSIKIGAGPRQALANATNSLAFDPQTYAPGTLVELRVEISDRKLTPLTCSDASQTCSVISQDSCIQRQTWRLEAR